MELAINSVIGFCLLYFIYYYALRFIQSLFQGLLSSINSIFSHIVYVLSTPAHELAHLLVSLICLSKVEKVKLFPSKNETGYVKYRIGSKIPFLKSIKEFFIGMGPALINIPLFIFIESRYILRSNVSEINQILNPIFIFSKQGCLTLILFILLIGGIAPSHTDLKGMLKGLFFFSAIIFGITYLSGSVINFKQINFSGLIYVLLYYLEIIVFVLIINAIVHYRNWFRVTMCIVKNSLKHSFSRA